MKPPDGLALCRRIWLGSEAEANATRLFRREFSLPAAACVRSAALQVFADSCYHLWVNGRYLGRGPTFFHPHRRPVATYDVAGHLAAGLNAVAVLVHSAGVSLHNYVFCGCPGLVARLDVVLDDGRTLTVATDSSWRVTDRTGWLSDTPRRS